MHARRRLIIASAVAAVIVLGACGAVLAIINPWSDCSSPRAYCAAADEARAVPGVLEITDVYRAQEDGEEQTEEDGARESILWTIRLDDDLSPAEATRRSGQAVERLEVGEARHAFTVVAGALPDRASEPFMQVTCAGAAECAGQVERAYASLGAGATWAGTGTIAVPNPEAFRAVAEIAAADAAPVTIELRPDGWSHDTDPRVAYEYVSPVDLEAVDLLLDFAKIGGPQTIEITETGQLFIAAPARRQAEIERALAERAPPGGEPMRYVIAPRAPDGDLARENGWIGGLAPEH